jgi:exodeoxyribonuclease V beta subunit
MTAAHYDLQYHLYAVALHRHLALRMGEAYRYGDHFGGVFYLFLRGMDPGSGPASGVFFDRPEPERIQELSRYLAEGERA